MSKTTIPTGGITDATIATGDIADNAVTAAKSTARITVADQWRLTDSFNATADTDAFITANLEQDDTSGFENLGSSMTVSSGVFTFPSTGIYYVAFTISESKNANHYFAGKIWSTNNNSSYTQRSGPYAYNVTSSSATVGSVLTTSCFFDVTNVSNCKVKFGYETNATAAVSANSNINRTFMTFIRLGDT